MPRYRTRPTTVDAYQYDPSTFHVDSAPAWVAAATDQPNFPGQGGGPPANPGQGNGPPNNPGQGNQPTLPPQANPRARRDRAGGLIVKTNAGDVVVRPTDWIIRDDVGSVYVLSADLFGARFEEA